MSRQQASIGRRGLLKASAAALGGAVFGTRAKAEPEPPFQNVNTNSSPSTLKITDLRVATVRKPGPGPCTIIRLDTNQGVYGLGEVRDGASATYALFLKSRVVGENPQDIPGTVTGPSGLSKWEQYALPHPFLAYEVTDKGIEKLCEYVAAVREAIGMEIPLSMDHLGHIGVHSIIRLGKAYEKYNLSWMEDVVPWQYTEMLQRISAESPTPLLTGEDIYLKGEFIKLCEKHAVSKIHPDISTSGGILETHKIGDAAMEYGVPMAMHYAGLPIGAMASVHCAAATENFLACENHSLDVPWWQDLVEGLEKPIINQGFITVPDKPGLGITLNEDVVKQHLLPNTGFFEPTPAWDKEHSVDRLWSMAPKQGPTPAQTPRIAEV